MTIKTIKYFPPFSKIIIPADYSFSPTSAGKKNHPTRPSIGCQFGLAANSTPNLSLQSKIRFVQWWGVILNYLRGTFFFSFFLFYGEASMREELFCDGLFTSSCNEIAESTYGGSGWIFLCDKCLELISFQVSLAKGQTRFYFLCTILYMRLD